MIILVLNTYPQHIHLHTTYARTSLFTFPHTSLFTYAQTTCTTYVCTQKHAHTLTQSCPAMHKIILPVSRCPGLWGESLITSPTSMSSLLYRHGAVVLGNQNTDRSHTIQPLSYHNIRHVPSNSLTSPCTHITTHMQNTAYSGHK